MNSGLGELTASLVSDGCEGSGVREIDWAAEALSGAVSGATTEVMPAGLAVAEGKASDATPAGLGSSPSVPEHPTRRRAASPAAAIPAAHTRIPGLDTCLCLRRFK